VKITLSVVLLILAVICFALGAFKVPAAIDWQNAGLAFAAASLLPW
jgi:hypothetical protein